MRRLQPRALLVTLVVLLMLSGAPPSARPARAQTDPDFSNVGDILQGRRRLLPVDDLIVSGQPAGPGSAVSNLVLPTINSSIGTQTSYAITSSAVPSFATGTGRMFNLPRDVIFTMTPGSVNVQDPAQPTAAPFSVSGNPAALVMADFNGDGFADVALLTATSAGSASGLLRIVTANDVNDITQGLFVSTGVSPQSINFANPISIAAGDFYGDGTRQVVIAQPLSAGSSQYLLQIYRVVTNQNGRIATQALQLAASATLSTLANLPLFALSVLAGNFDGTVQPANGLPQDELVVVTHAGPALILRAFRVQPSSTDPTMLTITLASTFVSQDTLPESGPLLNDPFHALSARLDWFNAAEQVDRKSVV